jgi:hypothetical protein
MSKKLVIAGSASLQDKVQDWKSFWEHEDFEVVAYPVPIPTETFIEDYPQVHNDFFRNLESADVLFVMNEDKNGIYGYLGAESFAEMAYAVAQNLLHDKKIEVVLRQMPDKSVQAYDEIVLWLKLGWIKLYNEL